MLSLFDSRSLSPEGLNMGLKLVGPYSHFCWVFSLFLLLSSMESRVVDLHCLAVKVLISGSYRPCAIVADHEM